MAIPRSVGKYEVVDAIGAGGMGTVYRAFDPTLERMVALKILHLDGLHEVDQGQLRERFRDEARAVARLNHPAIVTIFDFDYQDPVGAYIAMEYVQGCALDEYVRHRPELHLEDAVSTMLQVLDGLAYAHGKDVVHRDIKPSNLLVTVHGTVKITDFGIARIGHRNTTQTGMLGGLPQYMAPEQFMGGVVDHRCDIYAAGAVLYEFLTSAPPFTGTSAEVMHKVCHEVPKPMSAVNPEIPAAFDAIVAKALEKQAMNRWASAFEFQHALRTSWNEISKKPASVTRSMSVWSIVSMVKRQGPERLIGPTPLDRDDAGLETQTPKPAIRSDEGPRTSRPSHAPAAGRPAASVPRQLRKPSAPRGPASAPALPDDSTADAGACDAFALEGDLPLLSTVPAPAARGSIREESFIPDGSEREEGVVDPLAALGLRKTPLPPRNEDLARGSPLGSDFKSPRITPSRPPPETDEMPEPAADLGPIRALPEDYNPLAQTSFERVPPKPVPQSAAAARPTPTPSPTASPPPPRAPAAPPQAFSRAGSDRVQMTVFGPEQIARGQRFFLQAIFHPRGADTAARALAEVAEKRSAVAQKLLLPERVGDGETIGVRLYADRRVTIDDSEQALQWRGDIIAAQFTIKLPWLDLRRDYVFTVEVSVAGCPVGRCKFRLTVGIAEPAASVPRAYGSLSRYRHAFLSYAAEDQAIVADVAQLLEVQGITYFLDQISQGVGSDWRSEIEKNIETADLFLLCWSRHAAESKWVQREIRWALRARQRTGNLRPEIRPLIIGSPPIPPPPRALKHLQFNSPTVLLKRATTHTTGP